MERDYHVLGLKESVLLKITILLKAFYRSSDLPIKLPIIFFTELEQKIFLIVWKHKRPQVAKTVSRKSWKNLAPQHKNIKPQ